MTCVKWEWLCYQSNILLALPHNDMVGVSQTSKGLYKLLRCYQCNILLALPLNDMLLNGNIWLFWWVLLQGVVQTIKMTCFASQMGVVVLMGFTNIQGVVQTTKMVPIQHIVSFASQ